MIEPAIKEMATIKSMTQNLGIGSAPAHFAAIIGISVMTRKCPKIADPVISIRAMMEVFHAPLTL